MNQNKIRIRVLKDQDLLLIIIASIHSIPTFIQYLPKIITIIEFQTINKPFKIAKEQKINITTIITILIYKITFKMFHIPSHHFNKRVK